MLIFMIVLIRYYLYKPSVTFSTVYIFVSNILNKDSLLLHYNIATICLTFD